MYNKCKWRVADISGELDGYFWIIFCLWMFIECVCVLGGSFLFYGIYVVIAVYELVLVQLRARKGILHERESLKVSDRIFSHAIAQTAVFVMFVVSLKNSRNICAINCHALLWVYLEGRGILGRKGPAYEIVRDFFESVLVYAVGTTHTNSTIQVMGEIAGFFVVLEKFLTECFIVTKKEKRKRAFYETVLNSTLYAYKRLAVLLLMRDENRVFLRSLFMVDASADIMRVEHIYTGVLLMQGLHVKQILKYFMHGRREALI